MICRLLQDEYQAENEVVSVLPLNIPERIHFSFTESEESIYLCMNDIVSNKKVENIFYYHEDLNGVMNRIKLYQVIQNMVNKVSKAS
jgi:hypothetical protein